MTLFWLGLSWLGGIVAGKWIILDIWQWLVLAGSSLGAAILLRRRRSLLLAFIIIAFFYSGAARYQISVGEIDAGHLACFNDRGCTVTLTGVITAPPDVHDYYIGLRIAVEKLRYGRDGASQSVHGLALIYAPRFGNYRYGDRVEAYGSLETPPVFETFSYREYLARQGIHSIMRNPSVCRLAAHQANPLLRLIYALRIKGLETIYSLFADPEASLLAGILLGMEQGISPEIQQAFNQTGTTHIIAISGFNITIIAGLFISLFGRWLGARRGAIAAGIAIGIYTLLVGADAAVVRAAIMGSISLLACLIGRQTYAFSALSAASIVMTTINPLVLWDVGFQLSFAATLGLILYAEPLEGWFTGLVENWLNLKQAAQLARPVSEFILFTLAAQITTLPLTAYYFRRLSLVSFIANPVILPAQPAVMILGGLATIAGMIWLPFGRPLAWLAWPFVSFTIRAVSILAQLPAASIPLGNLALIWVGGFYLILFGITALTKLPPEKRLRLPAIKLPAGVGLLLLAILCALVWRHAIDQPDGQLHLTLLDVGGGESVLIESPTGRYLLVGGGSSPIRLSEALGQRLPLFRPQIDWWVVGATYDTDLAGIAGITQRFPIKKVLLTGPPGTGAYRHVLNQLSESGSGIIAAQPGQILDLGDGARLEVLALGENGSALLLHYNRAHLLLAPGADPALIKEISRKLQPGRITALILPDCGNLAANPPKWLRQLNPAVALISVQAGNSRGLPSPEVLDALGDRTILRTDLHGWIQLSTDGQNLWVEVERVPRSEER